MTPWFLAGLAVLGEPASPVVERMGLSYEAPPKCPSQQAVREAVGAYLGREEFDARVAEVNARVVVEPSDGPDPWRLTLDVSGAGVEVHKQLGARTCEDLTEAAGLMIAVALDPLRVSETTQEPPAPEPEPVPAPAVEVAKPAAPRQAPRARVRGEVRVGAGVGLSVLPSASADVVAAVSVMGRLWRVDVLGHYAAPTITQPFEEDPDAGARIQLGAAGLRGCVVPTVRRLELPACVGAQAGAMRADGVGLRERDTSHRPWIAVTAGQELAWVSRAGIGMWIAAEAVLVVLQPRFHVDDLGPVYEAPLAAGLLTAGPLLRF